MAGVHARLALLRVCSVGSLLSAGSLWFLLCRMLYDYVERKRKENSGAQLHVTYLVAGNLLQNGHFVSGALLTGVCLSALVVVSLLPRSVLLG